MKKILLPLAVIAVSGGYVWTQRPWLADEPVTGAIASEARPDAEAPAPIVMPAAIVPASTNETAIAAIPDQPVAIALPAQPVAPPAPVAAPPPAPIAAPQAIAPGYVEMLPTTPPAPEPAAPAESSVAEAAVPNPTGLADGAFTGSVADAYYGPLQVKVQVQAGRIAEVQVLQYPDHRRTSRRINAQALPRLISEVIAAQSSDVDFVSGATLTSEAFAQSLASALRKAAA